MKRKASGQLPEASTDYLDTVYAAERYVGVPARWLLFLAGMVLVWGMGQAHTSVLVLLSFLLYGMANVALSYLFYANRRLGLLASRAIFLVSFVSDLLFCSVLVYFSGGLGSEFYLLYCLLALKAVLYYPVWAGVLFWLYLTGPLYAFTLYYSTRSFFFLAELNFLFRYVLLLLVMLGATCLGWLADRKQRLLAQIGLSLAQTREELRSKTDLIQRTAQDLGNRLVELRSLQEGAKAISSSLALEQVLKLIVANASQVLGGARCSVALLDEKKGEVVTLAASGVLPEQLLETRFALGQGVIGWVVQQGKPALIGDVRRDGRFLRVGDEPVGSLMSVPLICDNVAIGALTATSPRLHAFNTDSLNRLQAFADQAAIAVKNSRLYQGLFEQSSELQAILRGIGDGVIVTDPNLNLMMMNPVAMRIFHINTTPPTGAHLPTLIHNEALVTLLREAVQGEQRTAIKEVEVPAGPGGSKSMVYQGLAATVAGADGRVRGIVTVLRDITSQKELEKMKSNFLSVVSHELKTPLHSIKGFVDIILMGKTGPVTEVQRDFLATVKQQTDQLQNLINDLLEFSRLESGQVKLRLEPVALAEVAQQVMEKLQPLAQDNQLTLSAEVPDDLIVEADAMRLEQVLTNLVDNAIKFTPAQGSVAITAKDLGSAVQVSVRDTGIGIPVEEQQKIFERFYQVDSGSTRPYRGTGLGLTICKHIVEHHRGRIWVESKVGEGSTFHFVIPKKQEEETLALDFTRLPGERDSS